MAALNPLMYWKGSNIDLDIKTITDAFAFKNLVASGSIYTATTDTNQTTLVLSSTTNFLRSQTISTAVLTSSISIELTFNPNDLKFNGGSLVECNDNCFKCGMFSHIGSAGQDSVPFFYFTTIQQGPVSHTSEFLLNGVGRESLGYFLDNRTHHLVFTFDASTGTKKLFIDGVNPTSFVDTTSSTANLYIPGTNHDILINDTTSYRKYLGEINHIAIYNNVVSDRQIYRNYTNILSGSNYSFTEHPTVPSYATTLAYSTYDFAPGTDLVTAGMTIGVTVDQLAQLRSFPAPRYKSGNTLIRLFNWFGVDYLTTDGGNQVPTQNTTTVTLLRNITTELINTFNYMVPVAKYFQQTSNTVLANPTTNFGGMFAKMANDNPNIPSQLITIRTQIPNAILNNKTLSSVHYLQNASGQFLTKSGAVTTNPSTKIWRPVNSTALDYRSDGTIVAGYLTPLLAYLSGRTAPKINYINENAELIAPLSNTVLNLDTQVVTDKNSSGLAMEAFYAKKYRELMRDHYGDIFLSGSGLSGVIYTEYAVNGTTDATFGEHKVSFNLVK